MDLELNFEVFFETGSGEQLNETLHRLPTSRQMAMFLATLPKLLVESARAGLIDPGLTRLDVESILSDGHALKFICCRPDDRYTGLVVLHKYVIPVETQTVVLSAKTLTKNT
ncbi:ATP-dependent RNA helicase DDX54-like [Drosophila takahashii]|uniref:ATP-dependent RNA helicase DDX54-like n=1 Tax=Drosophila takahashii TaxID=29030 RepID=UPI0007E865CE|nr:ATP-dependent RNA helicase DDX54-like [Drosophila takahashii]XP_044250399.1 ATP-dependent RNA helicase DDX54-like [Drosophila takahashii]XP_044250400.1 ATP-dependent RNA helicase DDX54-like [Drosophila takahashii]XP_044250533.1 ATP-dependent RNA helicase DDX54-like [Drosophila takahashii]XP_044250534.1 ATP-dependent RNA helicase DDX54-like [Drosophila takahashii]